MNRLALDCDRAAFPENERGASLFEFVLVFPLFMLIVMVIVDMGRVSAIRAVVDEAVHSALDRAISIANYDVDTRPRALTDVDVRRLMLARTLVAVDSKAFLQNTGVVRVEDDATIGATPGARLYDLRITETASGATADVTDKILVLRPGECATVPTLGVTECNYEKTGVVNTANPNTQAPRLMMEQYPLKAVAFVSVDAYTPFLFRAPIKVMSFGYRHPVPQGPFPAAVERAAGLPPLVPPGAPNVPTLAQPILPPETDAICNTPENWQKAIRTSLDNNGVPHRPALRSGMCVSIEVGE